MWLYEFLILFLKIEIQRSFDTTIGKYFFTIKRISKQDMMMVDIDMIVLSPCMFNIVICMSENKVYVLNDRTNV